MRFLPQRPNPVSSAFTSGDCFTSWWIASVVGAATALAASQQACTEPTEIVTPNMLLAIARVSLRVNRNRPLRRAMRA